MEERTLEEIEADEKSLREKIKKINKKKEKGKELSASETRNLSLYEKNLNELSKEKENLGKKPATVNKPAAPVNKPAAPVNKPSSPKEKSLENVEEKAVATADEMNSEEEKNKKINANAIKFNSKYF